MKKVYVCMTGHREDCEHPDGVFRRKKDAIAYMRSLKFKYCKDRDNWYLSDADYAKAPNTVLLGGRIEECEFYGN